MTLAVRKLVVVSVILAVLLLANLIALTSWLDQAGVIAWARQVREEFVTGTAITVILALIVLLVPPTVGFAIRKCHVCERMLLRSGKYCAGCGSRVFG